MKSNSKFSVAVIGGGASGLFAAIFAAKKAIEKKLNVKISVYESNSRVAKKILATGNGRCNFTNDNILPENFFGERELAFSVYSSFDNVRVKNFFKSIGLLSVSDSAGRVYPMSMQASSVCDSLRFTAESLGVEFITDTKITSIKKKQGCFILNDMYYADRVIIATGGKASPMHGSDGSGYDLLNPFGINITPVYPALSALACKDFPKSLKGVRAKGKITLKGNGKTIAENIGEIQYTDYGLSGIPSMQVSRFASLYLASNNSKLAALIDSCPNLSVDELKNIFFSIKKNNPNLTSQLLMSGLMPKKLGEYLLSVCSVKPDIQIGKLNPAVIEKIVSTIKQMKYTVVSVKGFADAQVTCGGVSGDEIDYATLELKKVKGMYVCGEIINVDGDCGGYNLQWAWSSGAVAGINCIGEK